MRTTGWMPKAKMKQQALLKRRTFLHSHLNIIRILVIFGTLPGATNFWIPSVVFLGGQYHGHNGIEGNGTRTGA